MQGREDQYDGRLDAPKKPLPPPPLPPPLAVPLLARETIFLFRCRIDSGVTRPENASPGPG